MKDEIWKDIPQYEGYYQVSNYGRVKSLKRTIVDSRGISKTVNERILIARVKENGYLQVSLWRNNKGKGEYVHRLVAMAFIPNPENKPTVNHKDLDIQNNHVENLEWATYKENNAYGDRLKRQGETFKANGKISKRVNQYDLDGNFIATYRSMREAERINGICNGSVSTSIKKGWNMGGYHWEIVE